jgi:DNA mismatch endonuclease (patch repair protein)
VREFNPNPRLSDADEGLPFSGEGNWRAFTYLAHAVKFLKDVVELFLRCTLPDIFSPKKRSEIMSKIKGKDTKIEIGLRKALWKSGIRGYRLRTRLPGKPDIVFDRYKVVIFCDGDFWHGYKFDDWKERLSPYWFEKIRGNMERDKKNDLILLDQGWTVVHLWEHELEKNMNECKQKVIEALVARGLEK